MHTYIQSEPGLWTVGHYDRDRWMPESDHGTQAEAAARVHYLNGGSDAELVEACQALLSHRVGEQPTQGWLRDNDASRTALTNLANRLKGKAPCK